MCSITCAIAMVQIDDHAEWSIPAELAWYPNDPYAVYITFYTQNGTATWRVCREMLDQACFGREEGEGDIRIGPHLFEPDNLFMALTSPSGRAKFRFDRATTLNFVDRTLQEVPFGAEMQRIQLDEELADLLSEAA